MRCLGEKKKNEHDGGLWGKEEKIWETNRKGKGWKLMCVKFYHQSFSGGVEGGGGGGGCKKCLSYTTVRKKKKKNISPPNKSQKYPTHTSTKKK